MLIGQILFKEAGLLQVGRQILADQVAEVVDQRLRLEVREVVEEEATNFFNSWRTIDFLNEKNIYSGYNCIAYFGICSILL